jgi:hypothetical protein
MIENVLTLVALIGVGCIVTGIVLLALSWFWSSHD